MDPSASFGGWIDLIFAGESSSSDALAIGLLLICLTALAALYGSLAHRLKRVSDLCRNIEGLYRSRPGGKAGAHLRDLEMMMTESPIAGAWSELLRRRHELGARSADDGTPVRFSELLERYPLIPNGVRRSLLASMPLLLVGLGMATSLAALSGGLAAFPTDAAVPRVVGLGFRGAFWGLLLATVASFTTKLLVGSSRALGIRLSTLIERTYRVVPRDEMVLRIAEAQLAAQKRNSRLLLRLTRDLRESLNAGLGRIEIAASRAADTAFPDHHLTLESTTQDLASPLQEPLRDPLNGLHDSIEISTSTSDTSNEPDAEDASRAPAALERAALAVEQAAAALTRSAEASSSHSKDRVGQVASVLEHTIEQLEEAPTETGEEVASAETLAGLRDEVTQLHDQMVESVIAARELHSVEAAADAAPVSADEPDGEGARSGYSALLHRYEAPRFSLDELAPELRTFDTEAAIERARAAGVAPDGSLVPAPASEPTVDEEPDEPEAAVEPAAEAGGDSQQIRLARFLEEH